ncbi:glycosyltransferase family 2 protein [Limimaricola sp. ASW11-118]|uniref:Glycosyltransferase family 2 protein n=1 Tax=Limimaricola litoreus TaxID=2955316 RepID=A0A9X2JQG0_9RHOB|nr:glycosyltransferase family 2 protein [Limimaricola litoreus]MCP1169290.1 glycosyltransferase family 2 protein [Limimaricola litoreus]
MGVNWTSRPDVSVCVPIYNEEDSVGPLHDVIVAALEPSGYSFEIVLVDDGSTDQTIPKLRCIAQDDPRVVIVRFRRNAGQTSAMQAGIDHACGRYIVTMDGDLQNDPADIPMMIDKLNEDYDLVVGWRVNRQDKLLSRKVPSKLANFLIGKMTGLPIRDNGCSLKVYRAEVIRRVPLYSDMHRFIPAMSVPMGARVAEVGVRHHARQFGESKYGLSRVLKVLLDLIVIKTLLIFSRRPMARFNGVASVAALVAVIAMLSIPAATPAVVPMTVAALAASLAAFLVLLGLATGLILQVEPRQHTGRLKT